MQGGDVTKASKGIPWFQNAEKICILKSFSKGSGKTLKPFAWGGSFAGSCRTAWRSQDSSYWTHVLHAKATTVIGINCNWH